MCFSKENSTNLLNFLKNFRYSNSQKLREKKHLVRDVFSFYVFHPFCVVALVVIIWPNLAIIKI